MSPPRDALSFPSTSPAAHQITPYTPFPSAAPRRPFLTLTYATSLDANLSLAPGTRTLLSGPSSKAMTHWLRSLHAAILIGVGTAIADDPSLNCRLEGVGGYGGQELALQPQPVVLDPRGRWDVNGESQVVKLARERRGVAPWIIGAEGTPVEEGKYRAVEDVGGRYTTLATDAEGRFDWNDVMAAIAGFGFASVMVEGGGSVINELLSPRYIGLVDSVIVTIAPVWLGREGVQVCPEEKRDEQGKKIEVGRLKDVRWVPLGEDVVLCGRPNGDRGL